MKHSTAELIDITHRYYPRGVRYPTCRTDDEAAYMESDERRRLLAARGEAVAGRGPWRAMLARLRDQFPGRDVHDNVMCWAPQALDVSYEGRIRLPTAPGEHSHTVEFAVSFLVPYYVIYATHTVDDPEQEEAIRRRHRETVLLGVGDPGEPAVLWALPREVVKPDVLEEIDREFEQRTPRTRTDTSFQFSPEEQRCATIISRQIEATYAHEPMPPEVGRIIVPDVSTGIRSIGNATLFDCLLSRIQ